MKKFVLFLFFFLFLIKFSPIHSSFALQNISIENLNSKELLTYLKDNEKLMNIYKVCSGTFCQEISFATLEYDVNAFISNYINNLKKTNLDASIEAQTKGFRVDTFILK